MFLHRKIALLRQNKRPQKITRILPKFQLNGIPIPNFFYGTAWKEAQTADFTLAALQAGFRAIDTANHRKHYHEAGAGDGIQAFLATGACLREDLFLQTKFTFAHEQEQPPPYENAGGMRGHPP